MRIPFRQIRHQVLFLLALVMLGAMLLLGFFATRKVRHALTEQMVETQQNYAQAVCSGLSMSLDGIVGDMLKLSQNPVFQQLDAGSQGPLTEFLRENPLFVNAILYDTNGTVKASSERADPARAALLVGRNLLKNPNRLKFLAESFEATVKQNRMHVSSQYSSLRQGRVLVVNIPLRSWDRPDVVRGVLSFGIHLDGALLHEMLGSFATDDGFILLTDRSGHILAANGKTLPEELVSARIDKIPEVNQKLVSWSRLQEKEYLVVAQPVQQLAGVLLVGRSRTGIAAAVNSLAAELIGVALIPLLAAGLLAWFIADRYLAQILGLLHGLRQVAAGVLSARVEVVSDDELGEAGNAFNTMAEGLERNHLLEEMWRDRWGNDK